MAQIIRIQIDPKNWYLEDPETGSKYRELPFENYSQLPYYDYQIETVDRVNIFSIDAMVAGTFRIGNFIARPLGNGPPNQGRRIRARGWFRYEERLAAFDKALPLLERFLTHLYGPASGGQPINILKELTLQTFAEHQEESVRLGLTGGAHFQLSIAKMLFHGFGVDSIVAVKEEARRRMAKDIALPPETKTNLWFDFDDWMAEINEQYFKDELADLKQAWLTPDAPIDEFYSQVYEPYLSGREELPEQEDFEETHIGVFRRYFKPKPD